MKITSSNFAERQDLNLFDGLTRLDIFYWMLQLEKPGHHTNKWLMLSQTDMDLLHSHLLSWSISRVYNVQVMSLPLKGKGNVICEMLGTFTNGALLNIFQNTSLPSKTVAVELRNLNAFTYTRQLMHRTNGRISTSARLTAPLYFQAPTSNYKKEHKLPSKSAAFFNISYCMSLPWIDCHESGKPQLINIAVMHAPPWFDWSWKWKAPSN